MKQLINGWRDPGRRRLTVTGLSGLLILMAWAAGWGLDAPLWRDWLMVGAALIAGWDVAVRAWRSLWNRHISIELLVTIAAAGALVIGEYWEAAAVTFLFVVGAYLEARTLSRTRQALQELLEVAPTTALVLRGDRQVEVAPHEVVIGNTVLVKPGGRIPVDGEVTRGQSAVDESAITGEAMPVVKENGAQVYAGTVNQDGLLYVHASGVGADTTLARIIRRVEEAQEEKAPTQRFIERFGRWDVLRWAALAEKGSEHPLARPILAAAEAVEPIPQPGTFRTHTGRGVTTVHDGHTVVVGNGQLLADEGVAIHAEAERHLAELKRAGKTGVLVAVDGLLFGVLGVADPVRARAPAVVRRLKQMGMRIVMLTGDDLRTARAIAAAAGIEEIDADLLPEQKLAAIRRLQAEGHVVAMVGDGINDAPALAAADIGMAMGAAGTDVAIETADIALMADNLEKIPEAIELSRATLANIRQNVVVALVTVAALLGGVLLGEVHMAGGMLIHQLSVLAVILNGMRLLRA